MKKLLLAIFISLTGFSTQAQSGYDITINLKNCKDTIAFLTFYQFDKTLKKNIVLEHGSLLLMKGATQHNWKHQIPKTAKPVGSRINLTFRVIH